MMEKRKKVLVIDDEPDMVEMISMALDREFEVIPAYNGKEGVEKARCEKPDAIVLDIMMPEKDGFTPGRELKADPQTSPIPILILTREGEYFGRSKYARASGMEIDAEDYLAKPVDPHELLRGIKALLSAG